MAVARDCGLCSSLGQCPEDVCLPRTAHAEGEHFTGGIGFLLNGTKQLGEELNTSWGSVSSGTKQVKRMRSIFLQGNIVSAAFLTPHFS